MTFHRNYRDAFNAACDLARQRQREVGLEKADNPIDGKGFRVPKARKPLRLRTSLPSRHANRSENGLAMRVTLTITNRNPDTIWNKLAARLGRQPTHAEATAEVKRILEAGTIDRASRGQLRWQRR